MIEQMGQKGGRSLKIPGAKEEKKSDRDLQGDIDQIIDENIAPTSITSSRHVGDVT